jgi:integration host factor subunit beta
MSGLTDVAKGANVKPDVVVDIFEEILKRVSNGERVRIKGFGSFQMRVYPGRTLTTPAVNDGEPITFKDSQTLKFKQSSQAKERLNAKAPVGSKKSKGKKSKGKGSKGSKAK